MKNISYSPEEVKEMIQLYMEDYLVTEISKILNDKYWKGKTVRSYKSVERKLCRERKLGNVPYKQPISEKSNYKIGYVSPKNRRILELRQEGLSQDRIAKHLKIPLNSVKSALAYLKIRGILTDEKQNLLSDGDLKKHLLMLLRKGSHSVGELSRIVDRSKETVVRLVDELKTSGYDVSVEASSKRVTLQKFQSHTFKPLIWKNLYRHTFKVGICADTQIGSKYQQMSLLHTCYKICDDENVDFILHPGDLTDGMKMRIGHESEMFLYSAEDIKDYIGKTYPRSKKGIKTYIIPGNHDYAFKKQVGYNIVRDVCESRDDLIYRGEEKALFKIKGLLLQMIHPMGGLSYALSYKPQKIMENVIATSVQVMRKIEHLEDIPKLMVFGHYHKFFMFAYAGTTVITAPGLQSQTPYLRDKGLSPDVGMMIIELVFDEDWKVVEIKPDVRLMNHLVKLNDY